ncbi:hypothetical protein [Helicobacter pylori]|uniref:hypothetical protein n=1 Tax=Helicobacter pylori TaxID=210 RepID=UPI001F0C28EB|nr:hypothetical protein [Helicobacter pylori]
MRHSLIITETAPTVASQTLMGIPYQTSLKHKSHNKKNGGVCLQNTTIKSVLNNKRNN